jgi:nickel superoxide dismutase
MLYTLIESLDRKVHFLTVSAHCDIPCKIYDPIAAQIAVLTMIRMVDLLEELQTKDELSFDEQAQHSRLVAQKEAHGVKVKEEVTLIWSDYIKEPQLVQYPELHRLVHNIMMSTSKAKQHIDKTINKQLLDQVNRFSEIFWLSKGYRTYLATCPYPPRQQLVYPVLNQ